MTPIVPWLLFGSGLYLTVSAIKNRSPKASLLALLKGEPLPVQPWYVPPDLKDLGKGFGGGIPIPGTGNYSDASGNVGGGDKSGQTPSGAKRSAVVSFAMAQMGERYVFGASGPNTWDCSGLTMRAYQQVGIKLPHHAASQQKMGTAVPLSSAQPGDLVFWGPVSGHVAIYLGNNKVIHAPKTGDVVKISDLWDLKRVNVRSLL